MGLKQFPSGQFTSSQKFFGIETLRDLRYELLKHARFSSLSIQFQIYRIFFPENILDQLKRLYMDFLHFSNENVTQSAIK